MKPLSEFTHTGQHHGEPFRRWFMNQQMDLIVWFDACNEPISFQFCFDKPEAEKSLMWSAEYGYLFMAVDDGDNPYGFEHKKSPMMVAGTKPDMEIIEDLFTLVNGSLPEKVSRFVCNKIKCYQAG